MHLPQDRLRPVNVPLPVEGRTADPERAPGHYNNARQILRMQLVLLDGRGDGWDFLDQAAGLVASLVGVFERCHRAELSFLVDSTQTVLEVAARTGALDSLHHATNEAAYTLKVFQVKRANGHLPARTWCLSMLHQLDRRIAAALVAVEF